MFFYSYKYKIPRLETLFTGICGSYSNAKLFLYKFVRMYALFTPHIFTCNFRLCHDDLRSGPGDNFSEISLQAAHLPRGWTSTHPLRQLHVNSVQNCITTDFQKLLHKRCHNSSHKLLQYFSKKLCHESPLNCLLQKLLFQNSTPKKTASKLSKNYSTTGLFAPLQSFLKLRWLRFLLLLIFPLNHNFPLFLNLFFSKCAFFWWCWRVSNLNPLVSTVITHCFSGRQNLTP